MDPQTINGVLNAYGISPDIVSGVVSSSGGGFNWINLCGGFLFGTIGFSAFMYGKKEKLYKCMGLGLVLMIYPYFVSNAWAMYLIGIGLCITLFVWRD